MKKLELQESLPELGITVEALIIFDDVIIFDNTSKVENETSGSKCFLSTQEIGDVVVMQPYYDTWNCILPEVIAGDATGIVIDPTD